MTDPSSPQLFLSKTGFRLVTATSIPVTGITGLGAGVAAWMAVPSSANLLSAMTTKTGTGLLVFGTSPTLSGVPLAPTATTGTNTTQIATTAFVNASIAAGGFGTVTSVSVVTANGVSGSVANPTTTPAITLTLGAITPSSVASVGTVTGSNLSGSNTGDQTITLTGGVTGSGTGSFAATVITNANLTGPITSVGNATSVANSINLPGSPTTTTQSTGDNSTKIATTAYVDNLHTVSGTYTPTLFNTSNISSSTSYSAQYIRVGNSVSVSGRVDITPTSPAASTVLGISIPVASNIANPNECAGTAAAPDLAGLSAAILGDAANDRATMQLIPSNKTSHSMYYIFSYRII